MPNITIYIRNEDWPKWQGIADKPDFVHRALENDSKQLGHYEPMRQVHAIGEVSPTFVPNEPVYTPVEPIA